MYRLLLSASVLVASAAHAFCGFYVSSAGAELFNDATMVVLMREGTRTVLSMQNNYRGPTEDFALVIPVPVILKKESVKTLPKEVFTRIDTLASPRLVEDYEPGVCPPMPMPPSATAGMTVEKGGPSLPRDLGVKVEAKFDVAEYEIVILSAKDALGLDIWLKENKYKVPAGAAPLLKPYVETNWKFFVARVNAKKVNFVNGQAVLSPIRFFYDSEKFELPVRLGLVISTEVLRQRIVDRSRGRAGIARHSVDSTHHHLRGRQRSLPRELRHAGARVGLEGALEQLCVEAAEHRHRRLGELDVGGHHHVLPVRQLEARLRDHMDDQILSATAVHQA